MIFAQKLQTNYGKVPIFACKIGGLLGYEKFVI